MPRPSLSCNVTLATLFALWGTQQVVQALLPEASAAFVPFVTPLAAFLGNVLSDKIQEVEHKPTQDADEILRNGYLTRAIGQTIKVLTEQSANEHAQPSSKKALRDFAKTLPDAWIELLKTRDAVPSLSQVTDTQIPEILSRAAGDNPEPAFLDETQWVEIVNALQYQKPGEPPLDDILVTSLARHVSAGFVHALRQTITAENDDSAKAFARLTLDFFAGIRKDLALIKEDTAVTRKTVAVLPQMQLDLAQIKELLEKALAVSDNKPSALMNQITQRPAPSPQAVALAEQIPDDADNYALALKATAESRFDDARRLLRRVEEDKEVELARVYNADAKNEFFALRYNEAVRYAQKAAALRPDDALYQNEFGYYLCHVGRLTEAQVPLAKSLAICERMFGPKHPNTATNMNNLAFLYRTQGKLDEAEPLYVRALAIREEVLGSKHPDTATSLDNLAEFYKTQGKMDEAAPLYVRALAIYEDVLGPKHPNTATSINNLGILRFYQGNRAEAEHLLRRACEICETVLGIAHPDTASSRRSMEYLLNAQGKTDEAEAFRRRAEESEAAFRQINPVSSAQ